MSNKTFQDRPVDAKYAYLSIPHFANGLWKVTVFAFNFETEFESVDPSEVCVAAYVFCDDNNLEVLEPSSLP